MGHQPILKGLYILFFRITTKVPVSVHPPGRLIINTQRQRLWKVRASLSRICRGQNTSQPYKPPAGLSHMPKTQALARHHSKHCHRTCLQFSWFRHTHTPFFRVQTFLLLVALKTLSGQCTCNKRMGVIISHPKDSWVSFKCWLQNPAV